MVQWREACAELQIKLFGAASKILKGEPSGACPNCGLADLRYYYHIFKQDKNTGTIWVWCPNCGMTTHLPRVEAKGFRFPDPFRNLSLHEFADVETGGGKHLLDRLDDLWNASALGAPERV